ncbi:hypothetical protein [Nonomuraea dietziae]|uniref:hypothetical protein n=1 Tax=Nonomuraea dietziae TaxID=65515 RepID=UPI0034096F13
MPVFGVSNTGEPGIAATHNLIPLPRYGEGDSGHGTLEAVEQWALCAPALGARGRVRLSRDGGRNYPAHLERELTVRLPASPAAVYVYDARGETRLLAADFDISRAARHGAQDPYAAVAADAADFAALMHACGGRGFGDISPNGGRHGYVLWAEPLPYQEMRQIALALARRYRTLDPQPMLGVTNGIIRPPGSWHRSRGHQKLTTPLHHVRQVLADPCGPDVWSALIDALMPELEAIEAEQQTPASMAAAVWQMDEQHDLWLPRASGPVPRLSPRLEEIAASGQFDRRDYMSPSEARQAIVAGAVACGWQLADVSARLASGDWPGLAAFYDRYKDDRTRAERLRADWRNAITWIAGRESGRDVHTRGRTHSGGSKVELEGLRLTVEPPPAGTDAGTERQQILRWNSAMRAAERYRWTGPRAITIRRVLRALLKAAQLRNCTVTAFGVRNLALLAGLDESTVAKTLKLLREEPDPFIDLIQAHHGERADTYRLVIPHGYGEAAAWRRWQRGKLGGIHPVFRVLGGTAALVWEQLDSEPARTSDLHTLVGISPTALSTALTTLAEHGLAERHRGGWVRGPADPLHVAEQLGVPELVADIMARYRRQRAEWHAFLAVVEAFVPEFEPPEHPISLQEIADAGPPPWMDAEPHGPPQPVPG